MSELILRIDDEEIAVNNDDVIELVKSILKKGLEREYEDEFNHMKSGGYSDETEDNSAEIFLKELEEVINFLEEN